MIEAIILGIIQGLTEFIPVSSTAHLVLLPWFFNWGGQVETLSFDIALHGGTLLSLTVFFWRDWMNILFKERTMLAYIVIATLPAAIVGLLFEDIVESTLRSPLVIAAALVVIAIYMVYSERRKGIRSISQLSLKDAVMVGISQAVALVPGVSRSGVTISTGMLTGLRREDAARFSFMLSMPVIGGATLLEAMKILKSPASYDLGLFSAGFLSSAITGFLTIKFLLWFFRRFSLLSFVYYRVALAVIIFIVWLVQ